MIDDDAAAYEITRAVISQASLGRYELYWVATYDEGLAAMEDGAYDLYLVDYLLGDRDGLELLREARVRRIHAPIILLTGRGGAEVDLAASRAGADDYLDKFNLEPDQLERSMRYALERRRTEEALRQSEERHRGMFDHVPIGLFRCTADGGFVDANPALLRLLGHPEHPVLRDEYAFNFYVDPRDRSDFLRRLDAQGTVVDFTSECVRPDGTRVRLVVTARIHRRSDGAVHYVEGAVRERPPAEDAAAGAAIPRLDRLLATMGAAAAFTDVGGRVRMANERFLRVSGADLDGVGFDIRGLFPQEDHPRLAEELAQLHHGEREHFHADRRLLSPSGTEFWSKVTLASVRYDGQRTPEVVILLEDVAGA